MEKLKNRIFSWVLNFEALYLEGWQSKSYKILLVCKKGFRYYYGSKIKLISVVSPETCPEKWQKCVKSNYAKNSTSVFKNILVLDYGGTKLLHLYIRVFGRKKSWNLCPSVNLISDQNPKLCFHESEKWPSFPFLLNSRESKISKVLSGY